MHEVRKAILVPNSKLTGPGANAILTIIGICREMHTLPKAGGLFDQDALFVYVLNNVLIWQEQRAELDRRRGK